MTEQRYRLVVRSAEEAVAVLRERFGARARVVSVRQVEGTGLARFLRSPKLEIIAEVSGDEGSEPVEALDADEVFEEPEDAIAESEEIADPEWEPALPANERTPQPEGLLERLVRSAGISGPLLSRMQASADWPALAHLPIGVALSRVALMLRAESGAALRRPLGERVAFIGGPGTGKTTALCKLLASDVFLRQRAGAVLKVDLDSVNPGDGLAVFCDALGVPCARSLSDLPPLPPGGRLYVDLPGLALADATQFEQLMAELAPLATTSRVLVLNAAYETGILKAFCKLGELAGCTHLVLTHLDELVHWGKLWDVLLGSRLTPLFLSTGQNVAGALEENVVDAVLARTFPVLGKEAANDSAAS